VLTLQPVDGKQEFSGAEIEAPDSPFAFVAYEYYSYLA
jgi:hypothetical protein